MISSDSLFQVDTVKHPSLLILVASHTSFDNSSSLAVRKNLEFFSKLLGHDGLQEGITLLSKTFQQLVKGIDELPDAFLLELQRHLAHVDAGLFQVSKCRPRLIDILLDGVAR